MFTNKGEEEKSVNKPDPKFLYSINFIHEVKIYNEIQNNKKILIFDLRKRQDFKEAYLDYSINLPYDEHDEEFYDSFSEKKIAEYAGSKELKEMVAKYKRFYIVIVMSEVKVARKKILKYEEINGEEKAIIVKSLTLYKSLVKNRVREMGLFNLGFKKFVDHYDFLVRTVDKPPIAKDISNFPSEVFDHRIYIGNQYHALNDDILNILKITHIVNVTLHVDNVFVCNGVKYLNIKIDDTPQYRISKFFRQTYEFIDSALSEGGPRLSEAETEEEIKHSLQKMGFMETEEINTVNFDINNLFDSITSWPYKNKIIQILFKNLYRKNKNKNRILIHCSLGMSRSPALAIMYVMKKFKLKFEEAYHFMKFQRDASNPICSFLCELEDFEKNNFKFDDELCEGTVTTNSSDSESDTNNCQGYPYKM